jgi:hypothetical protein
MVFPSYLSVRRMGSDSEVKQLPIKHSKSTEKFVIFCHGLGPVGTYPLGFAVYLAFLYCMTIIQSLR